MSFVMFAGCQYFGMMIGDRRSLNNNGNIKSENEIKVRKINRNVVTCAGGSEAVIHIIWRTVLESNIQTDITYRECVNVFKNKCNSIKKEYLELTKQKYLYTSIGIMGFDNNVISLTVMDFLENDIAFREIRYDTEDTNGFVYFSNGKSIEPRNIFYQKFKSCPKFTLENLKSIFYQTVHQCTKFDDSINDRYVMEYIERKDLIERNKIRINK